MIQTSLKIVNQPVKVTGCPVYQKYTSSTKWSNGLSQRPNRVGGGHDQVQVDPPTDALRVQASL